MNLLEDAIKQLSSAPRHTRPSVVAKIGTEELRQEWLSCADASTLARVASLLRPQSIVARALLACIRDLLSRLNLSEPRLDAPIAAVERWAAQEGSLDEVRELMDKIGDLPPPESAEYDAYAAVINLHKFLFDDERRGIEGVVFFCAETIMSKEYPTWASAMSRVADIFRGAVPDPFASERPPE